MEISLLRPGNPQPSINLKALSSGAKVAEATVVEGPAVASALVFAMNEGYGWETAFSHLASCKASPHASTVQVRNRTKGAAMILQKKCVAKNRLSVNRNKSRHLFRPFKHTGGVNSSQIKPERPLLGRPTFAEDFTREHSFPVLHIASIEISGAF